MLNRLEIRKLGESGETLREISCISGRITVFRSLTETELDEYKQALWGKGSGRFAVLLNDRTPKAIERIDSEIVKPLEPGKTVGEVLSKLHLPEGLSIESFLTKVGLGGVLDIPCGKLTELHQRIVRIVQSVQKQDSVILLHEPFEGLSPSIYEQIAKYLITLAPILNLIIVVTKLSQRPECWIESPFVSRVQLQRPRKATVGFGAGDPSVDELVNKVRSQKVNGGTLITHTLTKTPRYRVPFVVGIVAVSVALGIISAVAIKTTTKLTIEPVKIVKKEDLRIDTSPKYVQYPPEIQEAIVKAFKGEIEPLENTTSRFPETKIEILEAELLKP